ncbi:MAG TPA: YetF domain-containing protein [Gemmatimonadales bacterium]|nr:YetF domain-containing protein [Gemmatimonadales bacterium]
MELRELAGTAIRITVTYVYLLALLRLAGKRVVAEGTSFDLIVAFIVGDMPDDVIWGEVPLAQGVVAMGTLALLHLLVVITAHRSRRFARLISSPPAAVVAQGLPVRRALNRERISDANLMSMLRELQIEQPEEVELALIEPEGRLSVRRRRDARTAQRRDLPVPSERSP